MPLWPDFDDEFPGAPLPPGPWYETPPEREPGVTPYTPPPPEFFEQPAPPPPPMPDVLLPPIGPQSPDDPPAGDLGDLIRLGDAPEPGVPNLPPGGLWSYGYEDGSAIISERAIPERVRRSPGPYGWPEIPWDFDPVRPWGFSERASPDLERFRFVARPPRRPPMEEVPYRRAPPWPQPRLPRRRASPWPRNPYGGVDPRQDIPYPLESERSPWPIRPPGLPPRVATPAPAPPGDPIERVPQPEVPAPQPTLPRAPLPAPSAPPSPVITTPRLPPAPPRARPRAPRVQRILSRVGLGTTAASILRRYIARPAEERAPRFDFRDAISEPPGLLPEVAPVPQVAPPSTLPAVPDLAPDLTPFNPTALPFAQPATRAKECVCEDETEEEAEERRERNASNVLAEVRTFRRRMSQNSLDNLR